MSADNEGFLYPNIVKPNDCIECNLCDSVCQIIHSANQSSPLSTFAAYNKDNQVRGISSSGGIFSALAEKITNDGGIVFGAKFDKDWMVEICSANSVDGIAAFRGSKYLQAKVNDSYRECESILRLGILVLFSGTPCQISGLKHYLGKEYDNLYTIACVCHGAPSPLVWKKYLAELSHGRTVAGVNFRDKKTGWQGYSFSVMFEDGSEYSCLASHEPYMKGFLSSLFERPACSECPARFGESGADILLGDFWGINNINAGIGSEHIKNGVSLVIVGTKRGEILLKLLDCIKLVDADLNSIRKYNGGLLPPQEMHKNRTKFFEQLSNNKSSKRLIMRLVTYEKEWILRNAIRRLLRVFHLNKSSVSAKNS